jgi:hypothetical protein
LLNKYNIGPQVAEAEERLRVEVQRACHDLGEEKGRLEQEMGRALARVEELEEQLKIQVTILAEYVFGDILLNRKKFREKLLFSLLSVLSIEWHREIDKPAILKMIFLSLSFLHKLRLQLIHKIDPRRRRGNAGWRMPPPNSPTPKNCCKKRR